MAINIFIVNRSNTATLSSARSMPTTSSSRRVPSVRTTSIPRRRLSSARLDVLRILAADHSPRHPALRARRRHCATPEPAGISLGCAPNQHLREIRHGTTGRQKNGSLPPCLLSRTFAEPQTLEVHVCKTETLRAAYEIAKQNDGAPGVDGVSFEAIEARGVEALLEQIRNELT